MSIPKGIYKRKVTTEVFIQRSRDAHGEMYDYGKTEYVHSHQPLLVTCSIHGDFSVSPSNHTRKINPQGCGSCAKEGTIKRNRERKLSWANVRERIDGVHGNRYDYVEQYCGYHDKLTIFCDEHGSFNQSLSNHRIVYQMGIKYCTQVAKFSTRILSD